MTAVGRLRRLTLSQWILIGIVAGIATGWAFPEANRAANDFAATDLQILSTVFLRLIKALIVPLLFSTLVVGIADQDDETHRTGRLAFRSLVLFTVLTTLALLIGWAAGEVLRPGAGIDLGEVSARQANELASRRLSLQGLMEQTIPQSFFEAAAQNQVLQVLVFAILFAVAAVRAPADSRQLIVRACRALAEVMFRFTGLVMLYAPIGVGAAIAVTISRSGLGVLRNLGLLVLALYAALLVFILGVLLPLALVSRIPLRRFLAAARTPSLIAFSAASSDAALPQAMRSMEDLGVPRRIVSFVLPIAISFNLTGSTLFVALAVIFVAQASGVATSGAQQLAIMGTLLVTTKGIAAVPRASLVVLSATLASFQLPLQGLAVILAVDAFMDMARTGTNMLSHCLATAVLARWEGELDRPASAAPMAGRRLEPPVANRAETV